MKRKPKSHRGTLAATKAAFSKQHSGRTVHRTQPGLGYPGDPGMAIADDIAARVRLPNKLTARGISVERVVRVVEFLEATALPRILTRWPDPWNLWRLYELYDRSFEKAADDPERLLPEFSYDERKVLMLVLWSACISAAKTIAYKTRNGKNTPELRTQIVAWMDRRARGGPIYRLGMQAAPLFKRRRKQKIYLDGVPEKSPVRRFARCS